MGKMKELYAAIQEGEIETLRHKIRSAEQQGKPELEWQGKFVSTTYATYLVQFSDTFLKELTDDNISNANNKSERLI